MVKENAFSIIADTANCGEPSCLLMSITIMHESQIIKLGQSRRVSLDDVDERLPFEVHGINIALTPESHVLAELPDGFSVIWDGQHRAIVSAPSTHRTKGKI